MQAGPERPRRRSRAKAEKGKTTFDPICAACHRPDDKGLRSLGAPNHTDIVWLYGGTAAAIRDTVNNRRKGFCLPHEHRFGRDKVRILADVQSLSQRQ